MRYIRYGGKEYSDYDPIDPDYDDFEDVEDVEEIELYLDAIIYISPDGNWEYDDDSYPWAQPDTSDDMWWSSSPEYPSMQIGYPSDMVEYTDSLLEPLLPFAQGTYRISGKVYLVFDVTGISVSKEFLGLDEDGDPDYDMDYYTDDATIEFNYAESHIDDFQIERLA